MVVSLNSSGYRGGAGMPCTTLLFELVRGLPIVSISWVG